MRTVERSSSVVAALVTLARRLRARCPALLLVGGLALGAIPRIEVAPDCVLLLVLPPIVYDTAFLTAIPRFRTPTPRWSRRHSRTGVGLVREPYGFVDVTGPTGGATAARRAPCWSHEAAGLALPAGHRGRRRPRWHSG